MIPKTIHYCWFGNGPLPELAEKCIASWKKYFPDYEIRRWDETNFDVTAVPYINEAYQAKRWAFVSDYARFDILYRHGGLYFDTDVEVIAPMDDILEKGMFMGLQRTVLPESDEAVWWPNPGLGLAAEAGADIYREMLEQYGRMHFVHEDGSLNLNTVPMFAYQLLEKHGFDQTRDAVQQIAGVTIYPTDYFSPIDYFSGENNLTANTRAIHHFSSSLLLPEERAIAKLDRLSRNRTKAVSIAVYAATLPVRVFYKLKMFGVRGTARKIISKLRGC